jgi:hypothetical protein
VIKKYRRNADEVEKKHSCPYPSCFKTYGTDVSLNLHIKLKHNGGNKSDREKAAVFFNLYRKWRGMQQRKKNQSQTS